MSHLDLLPGTHWVFFLNVTGVARSATHRNLFFLAVQVCETPLLGRARQTGGQLSYLCTLIPSVACRTSSLATEAPIQSMSSLPTWRCSPKADSPGPFLSVSVVSLTTFSSIPSRWRRCGMIRSSSHSSPPPPSRFLPSESTGEKPDPTASDRLKRVDGSGLGQRSLNRYPLSAKSFRRRPLWKRILFASNKVRGIILLNVITVIYASDIPVLKEVEMIVDPALFTAVRFVLSAIPFLPFVLQAKGDSRTRTAGIELGFWVSLGYLSQALGLLTSEAGHASFLSAFTVITVPLIDGLFGATVSALTWSGALVSLVGVAMLESSGSLPTVGDILNFLSAVFFGIHMLRTEHISRSTKREKFLALLGYEVFVVALSSTLWFLFRDVFADWEQVNLASIQLSKSWEWAISFPWIPALYTGIFSTGLCLWAEIDSMRDISASETAIIYGLEPVWGAAFAWCLLGERWGTTEWLGAALVLCGSLTVQILGSSPEKTKKGEDINKSNSLNAINKQNDLSLSPVVVKSGKDPTNMFRKKEKL